MNSQSTVTPFLSSKFRFWSFVSMVLLVFVHGYNLELRYLQPWTTPGEPFTFTSFTEYFLANGIFRFRIPMLFIISGYLYALHDTVPYGQRTTKRLRTLLVPYLIWSAFAILLCYLLELFPYTRDLITRSHVLQIDDTRMQIHDYEWQEVLGRWIFFPVAYQLWFIRVLLIYNVAYPWIRWCMTRKTASIIFFIFATLMWLDTFNAGLIEGEGLLFFSLGVWIQKNNFSIVSPNRLLHPVIFGIVFLLLASIKSVLAFRGQEWMGDSVYLTITLLHKLTVISGLIFCWYGLDAVVKWFMEKPWFTWLTAFAFIIYAMHAPLVAILIDGMFEWLNYMPGYRMITFLLLPVSLTGAIILIGVILRKFVPGFYGLLTGGRGFQ